MPSFETSDGVAIAYLDQGEGEPLLLIHGFASSHRVNWQSTGWVSAFNEAGYRVIAPDNRGHGWSDAPHSADAYGMDRMARDMLELLDHLGLERALMMGYSMGARIAAHLAVAAPEKVEALVIGGLGDQLIQGFGEADDVAAGMRAASMDEVVGETAKGFRVFAEQTGSDLLALAACMEAGRENLTPDMLGKLTMPVLIVVGSEDEVAGDPEALAKLIPGAETAIIPRRDHMRAVGDKATKAAVLEFLERLRKAA
ncbi:alpha/beta fold hydrolase [Afifella aestuarii]|uniref:alpha/beta fold hydrolase n=1 Tax=Afifella aestuarii TaxID=1909496 RepID=UPI000FE2EAB4|nr:alpha/beta hydrolase [Afifella aestuarii]